MPAALGTIHLNLFDINREFCIKDFPAIGAGNQLMIIAEKAAGLRLGLGYTGRSGLGRRGGAGRFLSAGMVGFGTGRFGEQTGNYKRNTHQHGSQFQLISALVGNMIKGADIGTETKNYQNCGGGNVNTETGQYCFAETLGIKVEIQFALCLFHQQEKTRTRIHQKRQNHCGIGESAFVGENVNDAGQQGNTDDRGQTAAGSRSAAGIALAGRFGAGFFLAGLVLTGLVRADKAVGFTKPGNVLIVSVDFVVLNAEYRLAELGFSVFKHLGQITALNHVGNGRSKYSIIVLAVDIITAVVNPADGLAEQFPVFFRRVDIALIIDDKTGTAENGSPLLRCIDFCHGVDSLLISGYSCSFAHAAMVS